MALLALLAPASASAHAYIVGTVPASGSVVRSSPAAVRLTYDEPVSIEPGALAVYGATGRRVDRGPVRHPAPATIAVALRPSLAQGTYTVAWRVTSADTHVVHGVLAFSVGHASNAGGLARRLAASGSAPASVAAGFTVVRALNLLFLVLCGGGALALVAVLGDVDGTVRRRLTGALGVAGGALAILAALGLPFQAAEVGGTGLGGGFAAAALAAVRSQRFGEIWLLRAWLAVAFAVVALGLRFARARRHRPGELALLAVGAALLLTAPLAGHAEVEGTLATIADSAHVLAAAAWGGGLVALAGALALAPAAARWPLAARAVPRFSLLATVAVGVLLLAGAGNAIIEVSAWRGLWQSTYGELVLAKIALALPLLGLGAFNHRVLVPQLRDGGLPPERRRVFLRAIAIELAILAGVIAVTGVLIGQAPARNEVALTSRTSAAHRAGPFIATITVTPAVVGSGEVAIALRGVHAHPPTVGEVDLATRAPGGRRVATPAVDRGGPLRFAARSVTFARAGVWQFVLTVRTGLTEFVARVPIRIGADP